jgi:hypothetical protein
MSTQASAMAALLYCNEAAPHARLGTVKTDLFTTAR